MKKFWEDFKKFITRGNVVDMAVGVAVAGAFTAIVTAFNTGFITPIIVLLTGNGDISGLKWVLREAVMEGENIVQPEVAIMYGTLIQKIIDFLIIALTLFIIMRLYSRFTSRAKEIRREIKEKLTPENEAEIAKKKAEEEEAARLEAERAAEEKARLEAEEKEREEAEKKRLLSSVTLLEEIRDLLKEKK